MTTSHVAPQKTNQLYLGCSLVLGCLTLALGCSSGRVTDETRLAALTPDERRELCEEIAEAVPSSQQQFTCAAGYSVSFSPPDVSNCGSTQSDTELEGCSASAGDARECVEALASDPCGAADSMPDACWRLYAYGCAAYAPPPAQTETCKPLSLRVTLDFEGIYEVVEHTRNDGSCAAEGASLLGGDNERWFVVVGSELFGMPLAALRGCTDLADCQREIAMLREASQQPTFTPVDPNDPGPELTSLLTCASELGTALRGRGASAGSLPAGQCALSSSDQVLLRGAGTVRFERSTFAWTAPEGAEGCVTGARPAPSVPCSELEVIEGRFVSAL